MRASRELVGRARLVARGAPSRRVVTVSALSCCGRIWGEGEYRRRETLLHNPEEADQSR